jgi:hypothetical protein
MGKRRSVTSLIDEALRVLTMETADFSNINLSTHDPLPKSEKEVDAFIRRRLENWLRSWVIPPLQQARKKSVRKVKVPADE